MAQACDSPVSLHCSGTTALLIPCKCSWAQSELTSGTNALLHLPVPLPRCRWMWCRLHCGQLVFQGLFQSCLIPSPHQLPLCQTTTSSSERTEVPKIFNFLQCCCQQTWRSHSQEWQNRSFFLISVPQVQGPQ